jgi:hypothetical protein
LLFLLEMMFLEWLPRAVQMYTPWSVLLVLVLTAVPAPTPVRFFAACNMLAVACACHVRYFVTPDDTQRPFADMGVADPATMGVVDMLLHVLPLLVALPWITGARCDSENRAWLLLAAAALPPCLVVLYYRTVYPRVYGQRQPILPSEMLKTFLLYALILSVLSGRCAP